MALSSGVTPGSCDQSSPVRRSSVVLASELRYTLGLSSNLVSAAHACLVTGYLLRRYSRKLCRRTVFSDHPRVALPLCGRRTRIDRIESSRSAARTHSLKHENPRQSCMRG